MRMKNIAYPFAISFVRDLSRRYMSEIAEHYRITSSSTVGTICFVLDKIAKGDNKLH